MGLSCMEEPKKKESAGYGGACGLARMRDMCVRMLLLGGMDTYVPTYLPTYLGTHRSMQSNTT